MKRKIALIGAGAMGGAIGRRLIDCGHDLFVFDISEDARQALADLGATPCTTAADAAKAADVTILSLNSPKIVELALFGAGGVMEGASAGDLVIDMSSIDPQATRELAEKVTAAGLGWVDSPLSGGAPKAATGELTLMLGGTEEDVARAREVLSDLAANITRMGPAGAGQGTKLINQLLCGLGFLAVAEATELARKSGIDASLVPQALAGGRADSALLQEYMPRYATDDLRRTGRIDNMVKDLLGVMKMAEDAGSHLPLTALCLKLHERLVEAGLGGEDQAAAMALFDLPRA